MKLVNSLSILFEFHFVIVNALLPTLRSLRANPSILFHPRGLSRLIMGHLWIAYSGIVDEGNQEIKEDLLRKNATGVVLDMGAGHGHVSKYLDKSKVTKYIALEPNPHMHSFIRANTASYGFTETDGTLQIIPCGIEETSTILALLPVKQVDTVTSMQSLCTIPSPQKSLSFIVSQVLKPSGQFLFYEHVLSSREDVAWWQRFWSPLWKFTSDGCRLDVPGHLIVHELRKEGGKDAGESIWREGDAWRKPGEDEESLFLHQAGRYVKA